MSARSDARGSAADLVLERIDGPTMQDALMHDRDALAAFAAIDRDELRVATPLAIAFRLADTNVSDRERRELERRRATGLI